MYTVRRRNGGRAVRIMEGKRKGCKKEWKTEDRKQKQIGRKNGRKKSCKDGKFK
jgi:hypothetical protein